MFCKTCGNEVSENAKFCSKCGAPVIAAPSNIEKAEGSSDNGRGKERKGLFSKKEQTCIRCGKSFEARLKKERCPECELILDQKYNEVFGYVEVADAVNKKNFIDNEEFYDSAIAHNNEVWERHKNAKGSLSSDELITLINNHQSLTKEDAVGVYQLVSDRCVHEFDANIISNYFIIPSQYPGTIIDLDEIFAVGYARFSIDNERGAEGLICLFLTNDSFMPAFASLGMYKVGVFQTKSKAGREGLEELYSIAFPNLQYPVQELKALKKQIKSEGTVRGNMERSIALEQIDDAIHRVGAYSKREIDVEAPPSSWERAWKYGFMPPEKVINEMCRTKEGEAFWFEIAEEMQHSGVL